MADGVLAGRRGALLLLTGVELIVFLDVSIINLAMPTIGAALGIGVVALAWVSTAYQVTFGGFQLGAGRASDLLGPRRMFRVGLGVFTAASLLAGLAQTGWLLIGARALQGVGAALLIPAELALLALMFADPEANRRAFGVWSAMGAVGAASGVALGGVIVQGLGWEWIFLINVPIGIAGLLLSGRLLPADKADPKAARGRLDLPGLFTGTGCLLLAVYVVTEAAEGDLGPVQWTLTALAILLGAAFIVIERRVDDPLLPFGVFRERDITGAAAANFVVGATHVPVFVFVSLYFQEVREYSSIRAGLAVLPIALLSIPVSRMLIPMALKRFGPRWVLILGLSLMTVALVMLGTMPTDAVYVTRFLPAAVIFAVALPACFVGSTLPGVKAAKPEQTGIVSGVINTTQRLGAGLGVAVLASVAESRTEAVGGPRAEALNSGFHYAFLGAAGLAVAGLVVAVTVLRPDPPRPEEPAAAPPAEEAAAAAD
ncbi:MULTISPECIES: MFS transporter [unclassified Streptomyces]|uniref:MFS transporter n=1 Tax=unclassified Streptomyces TaxID=2593676 RepID=UPI00278C8519|nr:MULTISPECIES: MFS transporter [unclassified Streptomyces]